MRTICIILSLIASAAWSAQTWSGDKKVTYVGAAECSNDQSIVIFNLEGLTNTDGSARNLAFYANSPLAKVWISQLQAALAAGLTVNASYESWSMPNCATGSTYRLFELSMKPLP
jgi:hypothetical protein